MRSSESQEARETRQEVGAGAPPPEAAAPPQAETAAGPESRSARRGRPRRASRTRRLFLGAIQAQVTGTRILAALTLVVLVAAGAYVLLGARGSSLVGLSLIALAAALAITSYWFIRVMTMFTGRR
jgi:hypothetical protein